MREVDDAVRVAAADAVAGATDRVLKHQGTQKWGRATDRTGARVTYAFRGAATIWH